MSLDSKDSSSFIQQVASPQFMFLFLKKKTRSCANLSGSVTEYKYYFAYCDVVVSV